MKKIEKQLKKEVNSFEIDTNILQKIKSSCQLKNKNYKKIFRYTFFPFLACLVLTVTLCLSLIKPSQNNLDSNTYILVSVENQVSSASLNSQTPTFEIVLDKNQNVVKERGLNDVSILILADKKSLSNTLQESISKIITQTNKLDLLSGKEIYISTIGKPSNNFKQELATIFTNVLNANALTNGYVFNESKNDLGIEDDFYYVLQQIQKKQGGKVEDYLKLDIEKLLENLFDFDEQEAQKLDEKLDVRLKSIQEQYEGEIDIYESVIESCESYLEDIEDLCEEYEDGDLSASFKYNLLVGQLSMFINQFSAYLNDFDFGNIEENLKQENIERFASDFEDFVDSLDVKIEKLEDEYEEVVKNFKKTFLNF